MSKIIFVTGSTDGIGKLAAKKFAGNGHHVLVHGRNADKLKATISEIKAETKNKNVHGYVSDFSSLASVKLLIDEIIQQHSKIDVLVNNAGIYNSSAPKTEQGLDVRFCVNYFAPYLLTQGLLPLLEESPSARVVNLSSAAQAPVSLQALDGSRSLSAQEAYAQSKLALTMWSFYLSQKVPNVGIIAVNPGSLLNTKMVQEAFGQFWSSAEKGASIIYDLAISEKYETTTGAYFDNDRGSFGQAHDDAYHQEKIHALIAATNNYLNKV